MVDATVITFSFDSVGNNAEWIDFAVLRPVIDVDKTRGTGANEPIIWPDWHPRGRLDITSYDWIICTTWYTTLSPVYHSGVINTGWTKYTTNPDSSNCVSPSSRESVFTLSFLKLHVRVVNVLNGRRDYPTHARFPCLLPEATALIA